MWWNFEDCTKSGAKVWQGKSKYKAVIHILSVSWQRIRHTLNLYSNEPDS